MRADVRREDAFQWRASLRGLVVKGEVELLAAEVVDEHSLDDRNPPCAFKIRQVLHVPSQPRHAESIEHCVLW
jgi:hypothetical protein